MAPSVTGPTPKRIYLSPPHMGQAERELLLDAFDSNWIAPLGPHVDAFEREFCETVGVPHAAALSSGTAALHLALLMLGVGPGDEVIVSSFTFAATANAVMYVGATPVFIDIGSGQTWNMDPGLLEEELVLPRSGESSQSGRLWSIFTASARTTTGSLTSCERYGVPVVEDAAEALGATYHGKPAGSFGAVGRVLLQREQDHHDVRRRDARLGGSFTGRAGPAPGDPGQGSRLRTISTARSGTTIG